MSSAGPDQPRDMAHTDRKLGEKVAHLAKALAQLFPHRPRTECQICCESKLDKAFNTHKLVPYSCRGHLKTTCKDCIRASLSAQLDCKPLLEIGCSSCSVVWEVEEIRRLLGHKDKKRLDDLDILAKNRGLVPTDLPEMATLDQMLQGGTRFCPWCRYPFMKDGGCDYMTCEAAFDAVWLLLLMCAQAPSVSEALASRMLSCWRTARGDVLLTLLMIGMGTCRETHEQKHLEFCYCTS